MSQFSVEKHIRKPLLRNLFENKINIIFFLLLSNKKCYIAAEQQEMLHSCRLPMPLPLESLCNGF